VFAFRCFYWFGFVFFLLLIDVVLNNQLGMERLCSGYFVLGCYSKLGMGGEQLFENLFLKSGELSFLTLFCNYRVMLSNVSSCFFSTGFSKSLGPAVVAAFLLASSRAFSACSGHSACAVVW